MLFGLLFIITKNPIVTLKVANFSFIHIPEMDIAPHINVHPIIVDGLETNQWVLSIKYGYENQLHYELHLYGPGWYRNIHQ